MAKLHARIPIMARLELRGAKGSGGKKSKAKAKNTAAQQRGFMKAVALYPDLVNGG